MKYIPVPISLNFYGDGYPDERGEPRKTPLRVVRAALDLNAEWELRPFVS